MSLLAPERVGCEWVCKCCGHMGRPQCGCIEYFWEMEG